MDYWHKFPSSRLLVELSLWSADFTRLAEEIDRVDEYADLYHIDVSDGNFVPGFLFFADLVAALRPLTARPFHVHLMTVTPQSHIEAFVAAGADIITVHAENGSLAPASLTMIRDAGKAAGLALGLDVLPESVAPYLDLVDLVLMLGTPMGIKGVEPSRFAFDRARRMKQVIASAGLTDRVKLVADGGIRAHTIPLLRAAGVDGIVAGSVAFKSPDLRQTFDWLHHLDPAETSRP